MNGRVIVGGKGRKHPAEADRFLHIAMKVCKDCRYVEPQFTLRFDEDTSEEVWQEALDAIGADDTYPTFYNDMVNVPAVAYGMRVDEEKAKRYVPFGCTEFVLWGQSTGTPNICINLLKILTIYMNNGIDPMDGQYKLGTVRPKNMSEIKSFEEFYEGFLELLDYYMDLSADAQFKSYGIMNEHVRYLFNSILMDDCIDRGKALLDGGVTLSGGEVMLQWKAAKELLKMVKGAGIHTAIETCGDVPMESFEKLTEYVDLFLYDMKHIVPEKVRNVTGGDLERIIKNLLIWQNVNKTMSSFVFR